MVFGIMAGLLRKRGSHTPAGNFSSKRGNKNFYKGKGAQSYGKIDKWGKPSKGPGCSLRLASLYSLLVVRSTGIWRATRLPNWYVPNLTGFKVRVADPERPPDHELAHECLLIAA